MKCENAFPRPSRVEGGVLVGSGHPFGTAQEVIKCISPTNHKKTK